MKKDKKKKKYMGGGMIKMGYGDGGQFKVQPGPSVDGMDVDTNVKKPNKTMTPMFTMNAVIIRKI